MTWGTRGEGADAFHLSGSVLVNLLPASEALVPYAAVGGGLYHVSFDLDTPRFFGPAGTQFLSGTRVCPAPGSGFRAGLWVWHGQVSGHGWWVLGPSARCRRSTPAALGRWTFREVGGGARVISRTRP